MANTQSLLSFFRTSLRAFQSSDAPLRILRTVALNDEHRKLYPDQLMVLDASFNPPTHAHLHLATSALRDHNVPSGSTRLVLLLATQNADKAPKPAALEHRLCMMTLFADDVVRSLHATEEANLAVDIGVTKLPYFVGKAEALSDPQNYAFGQTEGESLQQVHLVGYDTLIRIFDPKYYSPRHDLSSLQSLFTHHRLRVTFRAGSDWGDQQEQLDYLEAIRDGRRDGDGARREWADRIAFAENKTNVDEPVSSTKARTAAKEEDVKKVEKFCPIAVADWIKTENLYINEE